MNDASGRHIAPDLYSDTEDVLASMVGASIRYRLVFGPNTGSKAADVANRT